MTDLITRLTPALRGRYRIEREVGHGGMAVVFLAEDLKHRREVALKVLRPEITAALGAERFLQEIGTVARLTHPNILPLHDSGEADGLLYYVMPYVEGESLRARLDRTGALPLDDAVRITTEAGDALGYAHARGIVHRDVKPENILLAAGHAVVSDFGIARAIDAAGGTRLTSTGLVVGTPAYMSPEQASAAAVDQRSDLYSLACVLYEMLAGEPPHRAPTVQAILAKRLGEPPPSVRVTRDVVPEAIDASIRTALARNPADRFRGVPEFLQALDTGRREVAGAAHPPPAAGRPRHWLARAAVGAAVVLLTVVGALLLRNAAGPAVAPTRLAVLPFSVRGDAEFQYLSEGIGDLLARSLDGVGDLRTVDPSAVLSALGLDGNRAPATPQYRAVARRVGAGLYLLGSVNVIGGRLRIQAGLYDATAEATADALSQHGVEGAAADVLALVDQLAARLLVERGGTPGRVFETAALTTHSLAALRYYLTAEHLLRSGPGRVDSAIAGFQRAVAEDSTFALAHYRLAVAAGWNGRQALATAATAAAVRHSTRLADRDRRLLSGYHQYRSGLVENAEQSFRALTRDYPDNLEAEFQLADLLLYYNPIRGRSLEEPRVLFDRVLAFDPGFL